MGALTHRAVATGAAVSLASVTYHYPSIDELRRATVEHAGSRIGLEFVGLIAHTAAEPDALPDICGDFTAHLVTERRTDTTAVFEMILAAGHDPELGPVKGPNPMTNAVPLSMEQLLQPADEPAVPLTVAIRIVITIPITDHAAHCWTATRGVLIYSAERSASWPDMTLSCDDAISLDTGEVRVGCQPRRLRRRSLRRRLW